MSTQPVPTNGKLRIAPAVQHTAIARRAQGASKRQIAKELGIARQTVDAILADSPVEQPSFAETIQKQLIPKALARVSEVMPKDTDTAKWLLTHTLFREGQPIRIGGDAIMAGTVNLLPSTTSQATTTSTPESTSTTIQAAAKPTGDGSSVSLHTNFSPPATDAEFEDIQPVNPDCEVPCDE